MNKLSDILLPKRVSLPWNTTSKVRGFYEIPKNTLDVVFIGSSHVFCSFNPYIFFKEANVKSYVFAANEQPLWTSYYYVKEAIEKQSPKFIVLESFYISENKDFKRDGVNRLNLDDIPFSLNKVKMSKISEESDFLDAVPLYRYHDRWKNLSIGDFSFSDNGVLMGYTPLYEQTGKNYTFPNYNNLVAKDFSKKSLKYLLKIINICKKNNTELILVYSPYQVNKSQLQNILSLKEISKKHKIDFINYANDSLLKKIGFDFTKDMQGGHTNIYGANKVSLHFAKYLKNKSVFDSNRDFSDYTELKNRFEAIDKLPRIKKLKDYINYLKDKDLFTFIAVKDEGSKKMASQLKPMGSKMNWENKYRWSYIGIFNPKQGISKEMSDSTNLSFFKPSSVKTPFLLKMESAGFGRGNFGRIHINGKNYAKKKGRGLSIVVFDSKINKIIDSVFFDTHKNSNPERNKIY